MREVTGDLWTYADQGAWVAITTNGTVRRDGSLVMGRGVALQAARRYPALPRELGRVVARSGNYVWLMVEYRLFSYPVKKAFYDGAEFKLIKQSAEQLVSIVEAVNKGGLHQIDSVYMVRPGCGNGGLHWADVEPVVRPILDDRFVIVEQSNDLSKKWRPGDADTDRH
jgi:hypothetical protein